MIQNRPQTWDADLTMLDLLRLLKSNWIWIGLATLAGAGIAFATAKLMTPIYRAEVTLMDANGGGANSLLSGMGAQFGPLASLACVNLGKSGGLRQEALATMRSRQIIDQFIQEQKLLPVFFSDRWDEKNSLWIEGAKPTALKAYRFFNKEVFEVREDSGSGLISVAMEWRDPELAARWANELVRMTNEVMQKRAIESSRKNLAYLRQQLESNSVLEVRQAIYQLLENEIKSAMLAQGEDEYAFKVIDPAVIPDVSDRPKLKLMLIVGIAVGLILSMCAVLILAALRDERKAPE